MGLQPTGSRTCARGGRCGRGARIRVLAAVLAASLGLLPGGCAHPPVSGSAGPLTLRFWNGFTGPDGKTMEAIVARFQRENPGLRVDMQIIPWGQYYDKLTLGLAFHQAPDVFVCHAHRLAEFAHYRALRALDDLQAGPGGLPADDFMALPWQAAHYDGVLWAIPLDCHPLGLYYNRRLFRQAGIVDAHGEARPPATWSEFLAAAHRLTRPGAVEGQDQWGFAVTNRYTNWYTFVVQHGGGILTPDLQHAALDAPPAVAATEQMRGLIARERVAPSPEGIDAWMGFRQGRVAMALEGIYMLADLQQTAGLDYGGAPVPSFGPVRATWANSHMLCMPAGAPPERAAAAWRLIRYLSDHSLDWAAGGQVPVRRSVQDAPRFHAMRVQWQFARQLAYIRYEPPSTRATEITPFVDAAIEAALLGLQSPRQALDEAAGRIDRVLSRP